jgi:hypothetical protein
LINREEIAIDEAELEPDVFAQKMKSQQLLQDQVKSMHLFFSQLNPKKN